MQWNIQQRLLAGIRQPTPGTKPMFFTLTFPLDRAPDESEAHTAWRSLVRRLRYRNSLAEFGWVLQRQKNETLHYHGIAHMPWFTDRLAEWRGLITASGFGVQNKLVVASPAHAGYCSRYISSRLAELAPLRRAYGFSRGFPRPENNTAERDALEGFFKPCSWEPTASVRALLG